LLFFLIKNSFLGVFGQEVGQGDLEIFEIDLILI
jgi:hypothetical protein